MPRNPEPVDDLSPTPSSPLFQTPTTPPPSSTSSTELPRDEPRPSKNERRPRALLSGDPYADLDGPDVLGSPSGTPSTDNPGKRGRNRRALRKTMAAAVETAGGILHGILTARDPGAAAAGAWLPDDDDVRNISDPLAGLASRRAPAAADNPDVTDVVALVIALAGYIVKSRQVVAAAAPVEYVDGAVDQVVDDVTPAAPAAGFGGTVSHALGLLGRRSGHDVDDLVDHPVDVLDGRGGE